ncbi:MAG: twin-arginine translocation signal domain-containing protein, partial [Gemmataceae bacterium]
METPMNRRHFLAGSAAGAVALAAAAKPPTPSAPRKS